MSEDSNFGGYVNNLRKRDKTPYDPFSHAYTLLANTEKKKPADIHKIVDREMMLGNIDNDELLRLYQAEAHSIANLASMADGDDELTPFYILKHSTLRAELSLTRAHKGKERQYQDGFARQYGESSGYGSSLDYGEEEEKKGPGKDFKSMMPRLPKANKSMF